MFPIKYMEKNLIFNRDGRVFAYYEVIPYNYSMLSEDKCMQIFQSLERMFSYSSAEHMHMLLISTEESIDETIKRSKACIRGTLKELAYKYMDGIGRHLKKIHGENEIGTRFYIGFELMESGNRKEKSNRGMLEELRLGIGDFVRSFGYFAFGDYIKIDKKELKKYMRFERLLRNKVCKQVRMRPVTVREYGYILEHLNGQRGTAYDSYDFAPRAEETEESVLVKTYDILNLSKSLIEEEDRFIKMRREEGMQYVSYLALSDMTGGNVFPGGSEVLYYQQESFDFPVDVSIKIDRIENKRALEIVKNKKLDLKDIDESAEEAGSESESDLLKAKGDVYELQRDLQAQKDDMYKISYVVRVTSTSEEELKKRTAEVIDYYRDFNMILQRPFGDQLILYNESLPTVVRKSSYTEYVRSEFLAGLGFGAVRKLGEKEGIYIGYDVYTGASVYIKPWLAAQGVESSITNALAKAFTGSLGGGKSFTINLLSFYTVLFGGKAFIIDPKGERSVWKEKLAFLGNELNIIDITSDEKNRGLLDPFSIIEDREEQKALALNFLTFITGISSKDGKRFSVLWEHIKKVGDRDEKRGMLYVIDELIRTDTETSREIASHLDSFKDLSIARLVFGDGTLNGDALNVDKVMNVILVQDLLLPEQGVNINDYSVMETLSVGILLIIAAFSMKFINQLKSIFKLVVLDESWSWLQVGDGKALADKLVRAGRAMNAAIDFGTQNCDDLISEKMKNNIGMKFAFRSMDRNEIRKTLEFFGLEVTEENENRIRSLQNGECLYQDIYGNVGVLHIDYVYEELYDWFDTRPQMAV